MATYTLDICKSSDSNTFLSLTYDKVGNASTQINISGISLTCKLLEIHFAKAVYQPGVVRFKLHLSGKSRPNITDIFKQFQNTYINLFGGEKKSQNIAIKYHLFDIQPEIKSESTSATDLTIVAYSPDKYLALDKYCKAYTGKKLLHDIVSDKQNWPTQLPDEITKDYSKKQGTTETTDSKTDKKIDTSLIMYAPQHLSSDETTSKEYIQPYLVQYNESFLDFLVRVMSRCGEFFFYENGKFHFGWKPSDNFTIDKYAAARFSQSIYSAWKNDDIGVVHDNYNYLDVNSEKNYKNRPRNNISSSLNVNSEIANDENLTPIPPKNKYTSMEEFALMPGAFAVSTVSEMLNEKTLLDMTETFITTKAATISSSSYASTDANDQYEDDFFPENKKEGESQSAEYKERLDGKNIHLYSTTTSSELEPFSQTFYTEIEQNMKQAEQGRAFIDLRENFYEKLSLGAEVTFEGTSYIVVRINGEITSVTESVQIEILPKVSDKFYPPLAPVSPIRTVSAQRAFVAANNDPMRMNRVRVRFPWQKDEDDPSPWIRIALPMASEDSGFNFIPENGDEAIVNFENGNIEKPYVEGLLYSADRKPSYTYKKNNMRSISSRNGHSIIFTDNKKGSDALSLPMLWSTINSFVPVLKFDGSKSMQKATGGIELTDEYGLYSISMSSNKRAISIDSPLGSVSINAFTGITISAPNGNIRIEGKNITLAAGNNVTIESGINKKTDYWPFTIGSIKEQTTELAKSLIKKIIDMGLIRTVMETFLRPIGGTMLIKSNRYLRLEAGKGETNVLSRDLISKFSNLKSLDLTLSEEFSRATTIYSLQIYNLLSEAVNFIQAVFEEHKKAYIGLTQRKNDYGQVRNNLPDRIQPNAESDWDTLYTKAKNNTKIESIKNNNPNQNQDQNQDQNQGPITDYNTFVKEAKEYICNTLENAVWKNKTENLSPAIQKLVNENNIKILITDCYTPVCYEKRGNQQQVVDNNSTIDTENKRKAVFAILRRLIDDQRSNLYRKITLTGSPNSYSDNDWRSFSNSNLLQIEGEEAEQLNKFRRGLNSKPMKFFNKATGAAGMFDQYVWNKSEDGKILFSDDAGTTLQFLNNTVQPYDASRDLSQIITDLKRLLSSI